jgi:hypothetical protein
MSVLVGDTTANGTVNSSDIAQVQGESGQSATVSNCREDVTLNGTINSSDIALVQAQSGTALPNSQAIPTSAQPVKVSPLDSQTTGPEINPRRVEKPPR